MSPAPKGAVDVESTTVSDLRNLNMNRYTDSIVSTGFSLQHQRLMFLM